MSWINNSNFPKNKFYKTESMDVDEIADDIAIVVNQAIKMKTKDFAEEAKEIMLYVNATNGYIGIYLYDIEKSTEVGNSSYSLQLPKLWEASLEHEHGSFFFDQMAEESAQEFADSEKSESIKSKYKIYFSDELGDIYEL